MLNNMHVSYEQGILSGYAIDLFKTYSRRNDYGRSYRKWVNLRLLLRKAIVASVYLTPLGLILLGVLYLTAPAMASTLVFLLLFILAFLPPLTALGIYIAGAIICGSIDVAFDKVEADFALIAEELGISTEEVFVYSKEELVKMAELKLKKLAMSIELLENECRALGKYVSFCDETAVARDLFLKSSRNLLRVGLVTNEHVLWLKKL